MIQNKTIALIAHDRRKVDMVEWVEYNANILLNNQIVATGTTGQLIETTLQNYFQVNTQKEDFFVDKKIIHKICHTHFNKTKKQVKV